MKRINERCICGEAASTLEDIHGLAMLRCVFCGVLRQDVRMTEGELEGWYRTNYFDGVYYHSVEQDRDVARKRLDAYGLPPDSRILDVGAGNGAFVDEARARGYDAWGQDLASQSDGPYMYIGKLSAINFPAGWADVVTLHDVLEHVPDPNAFLREIRRILKPGGILIVDFPRFHHESGRHHWKPVEHLWMLTDVDLARLITASGFEISKLVHPVPSKTVAYARSPAAISRVRIIVPPGIGDGYWVLTKLRGFLADRDITLPTVYVHDSGPRRAGGLWERVPFIRFGGYATLPKGPAWDRAYKIPGHAVQRQVNGFTYFISMNADLDAGRSLDEALPVPTNWYEPLFITKEERAWEAIYRERFGSFVLCAFWDQGFYQSWLKDCPECRLSSALKLIGTKHRIVIMGAEWDKGGIGSRIAMKDPSFVSLVGDTSYAQMTGLIRASAAVFGFPAGNTLLAPVLNTPTVLLWNGHFPERMWRNVAPEGAPYTAISTHGISAGAIATHVLKAIRS